MIDDYPVRWTAPEVRDTLRALETIYRTADIERVVQDAGLPPGEVAWHPRPALTWRSIFELAAGQGQVNRLLDTVAAAQPKLRVRLVELRAAAPTVMPDLAAAAAPAELEFDSPHWKNFSDTGQQEAIIVAGQPTFVDVAFLAIGLRRARSVCRLVTAFPGAGSGTAFRVGPRQLLTNHHVLYDHRNGDRRATAVQAWFDYEADEQGELRQVRQLRCDPASIVGEKADDWALVETVDRIPDEYPVLPIEGAAVPEVDDRVYIIQHPQGLPKKVAFSTTWSVPSSRS